MMSAPLAFDSKLETRNSKLSAYSHYQAELVRRRDPRAAGAERGAPQVSRRAHQLAGREQLRGALNAIARALAAIDAGATPEMFAIDLQETQRAIDELLGGGDEEAVRDAIFGQFCIGK